MESSVQFEARWFNSIGEKYDLLLLMWLASLLGVCCLLVDYILIFLNTTFVSISLMVQEETNRSGKIRLLS